MYLTYSIGFFLASLAQGGVLLLAAALGMFVTDIRVNFRAIVYFVLVGQLAGYLLWYVLDNIKQIGKMLPWVIGLFYGLIYWVFAIAVLRHFVRAAKDMLLPTLLSSMAASIVYGFVAAYAIKRFLRIEA
ncbi:MAG: hypothetical protein AB1497_09600 [Bacillota bacterium]